MSELGRLLGISADARTFKSDPRLVMPDCRLGVECEFEGVRKALPPEPESRYWTPHTENSLRNNGQEWVFSEPLFGADAHRAVEWILKNAKLQGYQTSIRTGLHVHVDARDLTSEQFRNLCILYAYTEPVLFSWVGDNREESVYCVPWYYADRALMRAGGLLIAMDNDSKKDDIALGNIRPYNRQTRAIRDVAPEEAHPSDTSRHSAEYERYSAFNLNALHKFGSVEFRHMQMTLDLQRTMDWINMLLSLKKAAMEPGDMSARILKETPIDLFNRVFGTRLFALLLDACKGKFREKVGIGHQSQTDLVRLTKPSSWSSQVPKGLVGKSRGATKFAAKHKGKDSPYVDLALEDATPEVRHFTPAQETAYQQALGAIRGANRTFVVPQERAIPGIARYVDEYTTIGTNLTPGGR